MSTIGVTKGQVYGLFAFGARVPTIADAKH